MRMRHRLLRFMERLNRAFDPIAAARNDRERYITELKLYNQKLQHRVDDLENERYFREGTANE